MGTAAWAISEALSGCSRQQQIALKVLLLKDSIPVQTVERFHNELKGLAKLDIATQAQLRELFALLQNWQKPPKVNPWWQKIPLINRQQAIPRSDLVTLGDYWLTQAIEQKLIQPLDVNQLTLWKTLPPKWQELVRRNDRGQIDPKGKIWGAPYRWGTTVIAYRRDKFESNGWKPPTDWGDLWREELRDRISLLAQPREVIGLTLKKLGQSYNTEQLNKIPQLKPELVALNQQVKFYSSNTYLQPLILGDTYVAVGWSADILSLMQRYRNIAAVVPQSGTALWADLWVNPVGASSERDLLRKWIDFCWLPNIAKELTRFTEAASPILVGKNPIELPQTERNQLLLATPEIIQKSEFLRPLSENGLNQYQSLWREIGNRG